jgi:peptide/nickel transport system permease protein
VFTYILRRILLMFPTLLGAVTLIFLVMRLLPGDAALYILGSDETGQVNHEALQQIRQKLGLDQPLVVQYGQWLWGVVRLDFGESYWTKQPVMEELAQRYAMTANLAILSLLVGTVIAIPLGVLSALKQDTVTDYAARIFVITGLSVPNFWVAILIILALVHYFHWLPPLDYAPFWADPWLNFKQLIFPATATGYRLSAISARMTRSSVLEVLRDDYVRTARAKGLRLQGMLSESYMQSWNHQPELVRQLRDGLGRRQVEGAEIAQYVHDVAGKCKSLIYTKGA